MIDASRAVLLVARRSAGPGAVAAVRDRVRPDGAARVARPGWRAPVPVVCCGNVTVGGAGKTTLVLDLAQRLSGRGVHILLRGYGGASRGVHRVAPDDPASLVGDEALLLAEAAPTWTAADRAASARAAVDAGAKILLMDDGLQNPTLVKTGSLLVIDGRTGFGNGRVLPAGPLREPVASAAARCQAAVLIGEDATHARPAVCRRPCRFCGPTSFRTRPSRRWPAARCWPSPGSHCRKNSSPRCARPVPSWSRPGAYPDHHAYTARELDQLLREARDRQAIPVTTPKDAVRLPPAIRAQVTVIGVGLKWREPEKIDRLLEKMIAAAPSGMS